MLRYFKRNSGLLILMVISVCSASGFQIFAQFIKGNIAELAINRQTSAIMSSTLLFAFAVVAHVVFQQIYANFRLNLCAKIVRDLKNDVADSVLYSERTEARNLNKASVITRYTTDINKIETDFLAMGSKLFEHIVIIISVSITLFSLNYKIAILSLSVFTLPLFAVEALKNKLSQSEKNYIIENKNHTAKLLTNLSGMEAIKNYGIEKEIAQKYAQSLEQLKKTDMHRAKIRSISNGFSFLVTMLSQAAIVIFSAFQLIYGSITTGDFVTIFSLTAVLKPTFYWISKLYESVISSKPAIASVINDIKIKDNIQKTDDKGHTESTEDCVVKIENLYFGYDKNIFENFSLNINRGEKILIAGESGSGKSTLIDLITKFLVPNSGNIQINAAISVFRQDAFIFSGSVVDNLTMFEPNTSKNIECATKICGIEDLLNQNPILTENGTSLSGGEKKRISLARTLICESELLILDEPLANIDPANIAKIEDAIINDTSHTIVLITHQISDRLLHSMDRVIKIGGTK